MFEDSTKPFPVLNDAVKIGLDARFLDQLIIEPLVISLQVVVLRVFLNGLAKVALAQWDSRGT